MTRLMSLGVTSLVLVLGALACGPDEPAAPPPVETGAEPLAPAPGEGPEMGAEPAPEAGVPAPATGAADPSANCLELVDARRFAEAVSACQEALRANPDDTELQDALELAQSQVTGAAGEGAGAPGGAMEPMPGAPEQVPGEMEQVPGE
jgi:hypothetical protein